MAACVMASKLNKQLRPPGMEKSKRIGFGETGDRLDLNLTVFKSSKKENSVGNFYRPYFLKIKMGIGFNGLLLLNL